MTTEVDASLEAIFRELLDAAEESILLLGAGVSMQSPASLMGATEFSNKMLYYLSADLPAARRAFYGIPPSHLSSTPLSIKRLIEQVGAEYNLSYLSADCIRMETILYSGWLKAGDAVFESLECFRGRQPNAYHRFAGSFLRRGGTVITTNFDTLIEDSLPSDIRVPIIQGWPKDYQQAQHSLIKLHGTLSAGPHGAHQMAATLRRVMAPPRAGQEIISNLISQAAVLTVAGYGFSDHFDVTPSLRNADPRRAIVLEYLHGVLRIDASSPLSNKLAALLPWSTLTIMTGDSYPSLLRVIGPDTGPAMSVPSVVLEQCILGLPSWQRAQILAELAVFLGLYADAVALLDDARPPADISLNEKIKYDILVADVASDARTPRTITALRKVCVDANGLPASDYTSVVLHVRALASLGRERLRHRQTVRAVLAYARAWRTARSLSRLARSVEEKEEAAEVVQVLITYGSLAFPRILRRIGIHLTARLRGLPGSIAPDVALLWQRETRRESTIENILYALESMNMVAVYLVMVGRRELKDLEAAKRLATTIRSRVCGFGSRIALARYHLQMGNIAAAQQELEEARDLVEGGSAHMRRQVMIGTCLCSLLTKRILAGRERTRTRVARWIAHLWDAVAWTGVG